MLTVFEEIAIAQPIGVSALARALEADKSAIQRDLMTLAEAGWIQQAPGTAAQWELTPHMLTLAKAPSSALDLQSRTRPVLQEICAATGETAYLTVPHAGRFMVLEAAESPQILRMVSPVGMIVPIEGSATARVVLALLPAEQQARLLGHEPGPEMLAEFAATRLRGYAVNAGEVVAGSVTIAAAVVEAGLPVGALVITAPAERIPRERWPALGQFLVKASGRVARG